MILTEVLLFMPGIKYSINEERENHLQHYFAYYFVNY